MSGLKLAEKIQQTDKRLPIVLMTGYNIKLQGSDPQNKGIDRVLETPVRLSDIAVTMQALLTLKRNDE